MNIDDIDFKILNILSKNSKLSFKEIGREVHLTGQAVGVRINKLINYGIIENFTININKEKIGINITAMIKIYMNTPDHYRIKKLIDSTNEIVEAFRVSADACYFLKVATNSNKKLNKILNDITKYANYHTLRRSIMFHVVDFDKWERSDHFKYYTEQLKCAYSITANLDVTLFKESLKKNNLKFYPSFIYCVSYNINSMPEFRMRLGENSQLIVYDIVHPNYTIFHKDDHTFSDIWSEYTDDFYKFYDNYKCDMKKYSHIKGVKIKPNQPKNFYCISCVPWLAFTGYSTYSSESSPSLMPIITYGKYHEENKKWLMPFTVTISHAVADGYHVSKLINSIQETIDKFNIFL